MVSVGKGFENSTDTAMTWPIRIRLEASRIESDTIYDTIVNSIENRKNSAHSAEIRS